MKRKNGSTAWCTLIKWCGVIFSTYLFPYKLYCRFLGFKHWVSFGIMISIFLDNLMVCNLVCFSKPQPCFYLEIGRVLQLILPMYVCTSKSRIPRIYKSRQVTFNLRVWYNTGLNWWKWWLAVFLLTHSKLGFKQVPTVLNRLA